MKRELEKLIEAAWKAERAEELWRERVIDTGYITGQRELAKHNLVVARCMNDFNEATHPPAGWKKCPDWVITACYYSMHRAVLSFLATKRWKGRGHEATLGKLIEILHEKSPKLAEDIGTKVNEARKQRVAASYTVVSFEDFQKRISLLLADVEWVLDKLGAEG
jgi:uncharacterized protein (UPF0332 family)